MSHGHARPIRFLTWNARTLSGVKLLALDSLLHDNSVDVAVVTETELQHGDIPAMRGFEVHLPSIQASARVRMALYVKSSLLAEPLALGDAAVDLPVATVSLPGGHVVVGVYRQFALTGTAEKGMHFQWQQLFA